MTTVTGQLAGTAAAQREETRRAANEATIEQNMKPVLVLQRERIAELEAEVAALRAVAVAADNYTDPENVDHDVFYKLVDLIAAARVAGYLPAQAEGVSS